MAWFCCGMVLLMQQATTSLDQTGNSEPPVLVTAKIAGELLGLSSHHVKMLIDRGDLAADTIGATLFVFTDSIDEYKRRKAAAVARAAEQ